MSWNPNWPEERKNKVREQKRRYYAEHSEFRENIREYNKKYRGENKADIREKAKMKTIKNKNQKREYDKAYRLRPNKRYTNIRSNAKSRGFDFDLTFEQMMTFWQTPCAYCGGEIETVNLDRIDNDKGYSLDNVCSCCFICNMMKRTLPKDVFISHCHKIVNFSENI